MAQMCIRDRMKNVLKIAKSIDGGFKVDFTVTAHWPASLNTIDPNDAEASKELVNAYQKICLLYTSRCV